MLNADFTCALLLLLSPLSTAAADEETPQPPEWKAAAATAKITPRRPLHMAGYAGRKEPAEGTEQDLFAKAIAIEDREGNRVVFGDACQNTTASASAPCETSGPGSCAASPTTSTPTSSAPPTPAPPSPSVSPPNNPPRPATSSSCEPSAVRMPQAQDAARSPLAFQQLRWPDRSSDRLRCAATGCLTLNNHTQDPTTIPSSVG